MTVSNVMEGIVTNSSGSVLVYVNVTLTNVSKGESHSYGDSGFDDLRTNAEGEWSGNLGSFTNEWGLGDNITYSASDSVYGADSDNTTVVTGGRLNLNLVLVSEAVNRTNDAINNKGEAIDLYSLNENNTVYRDNYGDIDAESFTASTITASIQVQSDDSKVMEWGLIEEGEALGFFKSKNTVKDGDRIRVPATSGSWWTIMKSVPLRSAGVVHHYETKLVRISDDIVSLSVVSLGTTVAFTLHSIRVLGSSLSGTDGAVGRVMTIGTTQLGSNAKVYLDGVKVDLSKLTITYATTLITITFTSQKVWNTQVVSVDYAT